jgi:hypothetical protein
MYSIQTRQYCKRMQVSRKVRKSRYPGARGEINAACRSSAKEQGKVILRLRVDIETESSDPGQQYVAGLE